mgnify:CR=1 FL=1
MRKLKQTGWAMRFEISYVRGSRRIRDSATTLDEAKTRIAARSAKPHNRGEHAEVYYAGNLVLSTAEVA